MLITRPLSAALFLVCLLTLPVVAEVPVPTESPTPLTASSVSTVQKPLPLKERFQRNEQTGVITDFQTGKQWREGPNRPTSWSGAQIWAESLKPGWRLPTRDELKGLFVKDLKGPKGGACRHMPREFKIPEEVSMIWAGRRDLNSAWAVSFINGGDCWECGNLSFSHGCRALAVATGE